MKQKRRREWWFKYHGKKNMEAIRTEIIRASTKQRDIYKRRKREKKRRDLGDHDLLNDISGDSGRGSIAPHHALVHLHQVLLLHSNPNPEKACPSSPSLSLPTGRTAASFALLLPLSSPSFFPLCSCFRTDRCKGREGWFGWGFLGVLAKTEGFWPASLPFCFALWFWSGVL